MIPSGAIIPIPRRTREPAITDRDVCPRCRRHQCVLVCPTSCFRTRGDGRVDLDTSRCIACRACVLICAEFVNISWLPTASSPEL